MVHLSQVSRGASPDSQSKLDILPRAPTVSLANNGTSDVPTTTVDGEVTTTIYGSRFAAQDLPDHELAEEEMPRDVAYRMIKDELSLDGNPKMKCVIPCAHQITKIYQLTQS